LPGAEAARWNANQAGEMQVMVARRGILVLATLLVAVFVLAAALGVAGSEQALVPLGALRTRAWSAADWWRILTFSLLHLTWWHLAIDTAGVLWLGGIVEGRLGSAAFAAIVLGGAAASGASEMLLGRFLPTTGIVAKCLLRLVATSGLKKCSSCARDTSQARMPRRASKSVASI
jgi:membrane associated rhomboid family serine protease